MQYILASKNRNLVVASHNQSSIEFALDYMRKNNIDPANGGVYFAQLLGMADHLTFSLGAKGYKAYKYVPYGPVHEVVPYLIRRAQENGDLIGGSAKKEINMARSEIRRFVMSSHRCHVFSSVPGACSELHILDFVMLVLRVNLPHDAMLAWNRLR
jgi:hypothetical protein